MDLFLQNPTYHFFTIVGDIFHRSRYYQSNNHRFQYTSANLTAKTGKRQQSDASNLRG